MANHTGRRAATPMTPKKVGLKKITEAVRAESFKRHFARMKLLTIPDQVLKDHPDKHFVWLNMPKLKESGFYHVDGYRLFQNATDPEKQGTEVNQFSSMPDNYLHRNEMVLGWIPREEHEQRVFDEQVVRGSVNLEELVSTNPDLIGHFSPHMSLEYSTETAPVEKTKMKPTELSV